MSAPRKQPFQGHKRLGVGHGFSALCECGWRSATHFGIGGLANASAEWRMHVEEHRKVARGEVPCGCGGSWSADRSKFIHAPGCRGVEPG